MSGDSTPGTQEGKSTAAVSKPRRASAPRSRSGFQKIDRRRWDQLLPLLQEAGCNNRTARKVRDALHNLVMEADFRTGEVVGSGNQIAGTVLGVTSNTWRGWRDVLVAADLIEISGVAVNGETDGAVFVSCVAWLSGADEAAPAQAPAQPPAQPPAQKLHRHNAPTSGNTPEELKNGRSEEKTTTAGVVSEDPADEVVVEPALSDEERTKAESAVSLIPEEVRGPKPIREDVIVAAAKRMRETDMTPEELATECSRKKYPDNPGPRLTIIRIEAAVRRKSTTAPCGAISEEDVPGMLREWNEG